MGERKKPKKANLRSSASREVVAARSPDVQTAGDRITELENALASTQLALSQVSENWDNTVMELSVMRDRYTEELNSSNELRVEIIKLKRQLEQQNQEGN